MLYSSYNTFTPQSPQRDCRCTGFVLVFDACCKHLYNSQSMALNEQSVFSLLGNNAIKPIEFRSTKLTDETLDGSWIDFPVYRCIELGGCETNLKSLLQREVVYGLCRNRYCKKNACCAILDESNAVVVKPFKFRNDMQGFKKLPMHIQRLGLDPLLANEAAVCPATPPPIITNRAIAFLLIKIKLINILC